MWAGVANDRQGWLLLKLLDHFATILAQMAEIPLNFLKYVFLLISPLSSQIDFLFLVYLHLESVEIMGSNLIDFKHLKYFLNKPPFILVLFYW